MRSAWIVVGLATLLLVCGAIWYFRDAGDEPMLDNFPKLEAAEAGTEAAGSVELATFASGCFWCTEAVFQQMRGVRAVVSGYSGGSVVNPTYEQVCGRATGHAECVQLTFDPAVISYPELLEVFWRSHDPTTKDRQGNDSGPQYRSVVFYHNDRQRTLAERYKAKLDEAAVFSKPIVTEIVPAVEFYPAEADHQNFYANNPRQGYCRAIVGPKVDKMKKVFRDKLKD